MSIRWGFGVGDYKEFIVHKRYRLTRQVHYNLKPLHTVLRLLSEVDINNSEFRIREIEG